MEDTTPVKRGRGRPRKYPLPDPNAPKRGRGRPRKQPVESEVSVTKPRSGFGLRQRYDRLNRDQRQVYGLVIVMVAVMLGLGVYQIGHPVSAAAISTHPRILLKVAGLTDLPKGERPQFLEVADASKVNQPFLKNAQNGDMILVFNQANKVILYRPSTNHIVAIGPLAGSLSINTVPASELSAGLKIGLYNGGTSSATLTTIGDQITQTLPGSLIVVKERATNQNTRQTVIVDLSGTNQAVAQKLAAALGATVGDLPDTEVRPQADLLVIVGSNQR